MPPLHALLLSVAQGQVVKLAILIYSSKVNVQGGREDDEEVNASVVEVLIYSNIKLTTILNFSFELSISKLSSPPYPILGILDTRKVSPSASSILILHLLRIDRDAGGSSILRLVIILVKQAHCSPKLSKEGGDLFRFSITQQELALEHHEPRNGLLSLSRGHGEARVSLNCRGVSRVLRVLMDGQGYLTFLVMEDRRVKQKMRSVVMKGGVPKVYRGGSK